MAGEWIPVDCNLGTKPEVLEVAAATHEPIEVVVGRMVRLWSWAWHVTADGTIRVPLSMLGMVAGGDEAYWQAVERAGWLVVSGDCITIPGWEERFGNAAKRRLLDARAKSVRRMSASCPHDERTDCGLEERRGEEKRREKNTYRLRRFRRASRKRLARRRSLPSRGLLTQAGAASRTQTGRNGQPPTPVPCSSRSWPRPRPGCGPTRSGRADATGDASSWAGSSVARTRAAPSARPASGRMTSHLRRRGRISTSKHPTGGHGRPSRLPKESNSRRRIYERRQLPVSRV